MKQKFIIKILTALFIVCAPLLISAQTGGTIRGTVTSESNGELLTGATVQIVQLRRIATTSESGVYEFTNVPAGNYTILIHIEGFSDRTEAVQIASGSNITLDFALPIAALREEVTVTASGQEQSVFESFQSVTVLGSTKLREQARTSLGEVLENEPGVGKRSFGPGSSRPTIRGFDGDRVLVAQDGIRSGSIGSQSGDHGESVDTLTAERIEIVKGPATLLYGSNAIGGVVNVISNDDQDTHEGFRGYFTGLGSTNNRQAGTSGSLEYGYKRFLFSGSGSAQREGNYRTPLGVIDNSNSRAFNGAGNIGYYSPKFFLNGGYSLDKRRYGIPYAAYVEENGLPTGALNPLPPAPDDRIDLDMRTHNFRVRGGLRDLQTIISGASFSVNYTDYKHNELENEEIGTTFTNKTFSYRSTFEQKPYEKLTGRFGFEGFSRDYLTIGEEALVEGKVRQNMFSIFALEEIGFKRVAFQFGGRIENNRYNPSNNVYFDRSFTGFSAAAGVRVNVWEGGTFVTNFTSAYRAPALEELYNNGAHLGTVTFEIGNENLTRERTNGIEFSLRQNMKRVRLEGSFFYYNINNFVFLAPQDADGNGVIDREDGLCP